MLFIADECRTILLKALLHSVLKQMPKRFSGEVLRSPIDRLLTPGNTQVGTNHTPNLVPVLPGQNV